MAADFYAAPWPRGAAAASAQDLSDAEFAELDGLLAAIPEPLDPLDAVMLDGFLCGVIVQPVLLDIETWLPYVFDAGGHRWGEATPGDEQLRARALIARRHAALNTSLAEFGGFDPFVLEPAPPEADAEATTSPAGDRDPVADVLAPWVIGFEQALHLFLALVELDEPAVEAVRSQLARWLPDDALDEAAATPSATAKPPVETSIDAAIGELVRAVGGLYDMTTPMRYKVDAVRREAPKVGRNDPCPCGSGRKFKQCHGAAGAG